MKTTIISQLTIKPEEYGEEIYEEVDWTSVDSEMTDGQRRFINGLVQYYQLESILELGVSAGGGTMVLLNAMENEGTLCSIDSATQFYRNEELPVGYYALERYGNLLNKRWNLITGQDPASVVEVMDKKFDFCVIDTYHHHPVEVLNFITVLPWLKDGAVVVMHDTAAFEWRTKATFLRMLAPRLLLSTVCAEKYIPDLPSGNMMVSNIAAWQISADTRKYCQNLFDILYLPWETSISKITCQSIRTLVSKYYSEKLLHYYEEAVRINISMFLDKQFGMFNFEEKFKKMRKDTVFYGAGRKMRELIEILEWSEGIFDFQIWDRRAESIQEINGHAVLKPDFNTHAKDGQVMTVIIESDEIFEEIRKQFEPLGYRVFHGLDKYMITC